MQRVLHGVGVVAAMWARFVCPLSDLKLEVHEIAMTRQQLKHVVTQTAVLPLDPLNEVGVDGLERPLASQRWTAQILRLPVIQDELIRASNFSRSSPVQSPLAMRVVILSYTLSAHRDDVQRRYPGQERCRVARGCAVSRDHPDGQDSLNTAQGPLRFLDRTKASHQIGAP